MLASFRQHPLFWLSIVALALYPVLHYTSPITAYLKPALDALLFGVAVILTWSWGSSAYRAIRRGAREPWDKITISIWLAWFALMLQRIYVIAITVFTIPDGTPQGIRPQWLIDTPIAGEVALLILVAGLSGIFASVSGVDVPRREYTNTLIAIACGSALAGASLAVFVMKGGAS